MIHVDVKNTSALGRNEFKLETSVDGGPWKEQWICHERTRAEMIGRVFSSGVAFAGAEVRLTMFGESRPVPFP